MYKMITRSVQALRRSATHHSQTAKVVHKLRLWDFADETSFAMGELLYLFRYNGWEMNSSKIALDAQRTETITLWRRENVYPMSFVGAYSKPQQRQNRKIIKKSQAQARRDARTHLLCELGSLWQKYFPESKYIDPHNEDELAVVARAMAILADDPMFARLWLKMTAKMKMGQQENPVGPA